MFAAGGADPFTLTLTRAFQNSADLEETPWQAWNRGMPRSRPGKPGKQATDDGSPPARAIPVYRGSVRDGARSVRRECPRRALRPGEVRFVPVVLRCPRLRAVRADL